MLRRIAYVETRDGSDPDTYSEGNNGGIWAVSETAFENTGSALLALEHKQIVQQFGIDYDTPAMIGVAAYDVIQFLWLSWWLATHSNTMCVMHAYNYFISRMH